MGRSERLAERRTKTEFKAMHITNKRMAETPTNSMITQIELKSEVAGVAESTGITGITGIMR